MDGADVPVPRSDRRVLPPPPTPVRQALISSSGPFWDTVIICALTGIVLTTSIIAHPDISCTDGPRLTTLAFSKIPYIGSPLLTLSLVTFVVSTILGFIPFMVGTDKEAFWFPLAAGTIGGLVMSIIGIFFFLPVFSLKRKEVCKYSKRRVALKS